MDGKALQPRRQIVLQDSNARTVDEVEYQLGFPWPTVGEAPGYSIELINPSLDNSLGGSWRASVLGDAAVQSKGLIAEQAQWKYLPGLSEASQPGNAWRELNFDDSTWLTGTAPVGYGEAFISTRLDDMRERIHLCFSENVSRG